MPHFTYTDPGKILSRPQPERLHYILQPFLEAYETETPLEYREIHPNSAGHLEVFNLLNRYLRGDLDQLNDKTVVFEEGVSRDQSGNRYIGTDPFDPNHLLSEKHLEQFEQIIEDYEEERDEISEPLFESELEEILIEPEEIVFFPLSPVPLPYSIRREDNLSIEPVFPQAIEKTNEKLKGKGKKTIEVSPKKYEEGFSSFKQGIFKFSTAFFDSNLAKDRYLSDYDDRERGEKELEDWIAWNKKMFKESFKTIFRRINPEKMLIYSRIGYFAHDYIVDLYEEKMGETYKEPEIMRNLDKSQWGTCADSALKILSNQIKDSLDLD